MTSPELDVYEGPMAKTSGLTLGANPDEGIATISTGTTPPPVIVDPDPGL